MLISICIPCYKSSKTLPKVYESVVEEFKKHPEHDYQFVLVNDGSPDATFAAIKEIAAKDEKVTGVDLSRNYGQVNAKMAALQYAKGDVICFMDDDGQHPAEGIFQLLAKMQEGGYDVVYAHFAKKKASFFKKLTSDLHNHIAEKMENKPKGVHRSSFTV
ncbi:MAG: glycosyltransferase, partial [Eubacterium sp.]|nr:glycosyltransferase [Eubacterium sp.]